MKPQTPVQILRCLTLGGYTARVVDSRLQTSGPQPLAGTLPASIRVRRDEIVNFLDEYCGGVWPPAPGSRLREVEQFLDCGLAVALDVVEAAQWRAA